MAYIEVLEKALGKIAKKDFLPLQPGDVPETYADMDEIVKKFNFKPSTNIEEGISKFASWFLEYYES